MAEAAKRAQNRSWYVDERVRISSDVLLFTYTNQALYRIGSNHARLPTTKTQPMPRRLVKVLQGQMAVLLSKARLSLGFMPPTTRHFATHLVLFARRSLSRLGRRTYKIGSGRTRSRWAAAYIMPAATPRSPRMVQRLVDQHHKREQEHQIQYWASERLKGPSPLDRKCALRPSLREQMYNRWAKHPSLHKHSNLPDQKMIINTTIV